MSIAKAPEPRSGEPRAPASRTAGPGGRGDIALGAGVAAALCAIAFGAEGGTGLAASTWTEIAVVLAAAALGVLVILRDRPARAWGLWTLVLLAALAALTALSILWAVEPADAWLEANRTFAYVAALGAGLALVRLAPGRWRGMVGGVLVATLVVAAAGVVTKVFPATFTPDDAFARVREPFGYWNAVGLMAGLGVPACLWLGTRADRRDRWAAAAYPALGLLLLVVLLSYSRGALLALAVGAALWVAIIPRRLRAFALLATAGSAAGLLAAWAFAQDGLSTDRAPLALRDGAGHDLGWLVLAMLGLLALLGLLVDLARTGRPLSPTGRRRAGIAAIVALALLPLAGVVALTASERGLTGSISHAADRLTDPNAKVPSNKPDRLTAVGSVRAQYWDEALRVFADHPWRGVGAGGYATARRRYADNDLEVRHAHGYVVQTLADLGLLGLGVSLALLAAWLLAAARSTGLGRRARGRPWSPERVGLLTLATTVVVFGVSSLVDWTWSVPATAMLALLCAGWVAGRGPLDRAPAALEAAPDGSPRAHRPTAERLALAGGLAVLALAMAWAIWQPLRSDRAADAAAAALERGDTARALSEIRTAHDRNPLSVEPLFDQAVIEQSAGADGAARATLERAVALQPANPETWRRLGELELTALRDPRAALGPLAASLYLDPRSRAGLADYDAARRRLERG